MPQVPLELNLVHDTNRLRLNDGVNYELAANPFKREVAKRRSDGIYNTVKETIVLNIRGTSPQHVQQNIDALVKRVDRVHSFVEGANTNGLVLECLISGALTVEQGKAFATRIYDAELRLPQSDLNFALYQGLPGVALEITRGVWYDSYQYTRMPNFSGGIFTFPAGGIVGVNPAGYPKGYITYSGIPHADYEAALCIWQQQPIFRTSLASITDFPAYQIGSSRPIQAIPVASGTPLVGASFTTYVSSNFAVGGSFARITDSTSFSLSQSLTYGNTTHAFQRVHVFFTAATSGPEWEVLFNTIGQSPALQVTVSGAAKVYYAGEIENTTGLATITMGVLKKVAGSNSIDINQVVFASADGNDTQIAKMIAHNNSMLTCNPELSNYHIGGAMYAEPSRSTIILTFGGIPANASAVISASNLGTAPNFFDNSVSFTGTPDPSNSYYLHYLQCGYTGNFSLINEVSGTAASGIAYPVNRYPYMPRI